MSDTHFDPLYQEGARDICEEPMCCRASHGMAKSNESAAGKWGGWKCDIPERTVDNLLQHIKDTHSVSNFLCDPAAFPGGADTILKILDFFSQSFDYIIFTGDIPPHATWSQTVEESLVALNSTISKLIYYFPNTTVYPALGNHETSPPHK